MPVNQPHQSTLITAVNRLKKHDSRLVAVIDQVGPCRLERGVQGLTALIYTVIGQQLSNSSARAIRSRLDTLFGNDRIDPERLANTSDEELRKTGLSLMKTRCLHSLADHVLTGKLDFLKLETMDDEAVINALSRVKGVGRWTAEMYMIFSLGRLDVFPINDLAIRTAMTRIYGLAEPGFDAQARKIADRWRPYRTVASWYLYRYLDMFRSHRRQIKQPRLSA